MKLITSNTKRLYGYLKKDYMLLAKRKKYLYLFILLPLVIASLFLFALSPGEYEIKVGVCDFDKSDYSTAAYTNLESFEPILLDNEDCLENLNSMLKRKEIDLGLEIPGGFKRNIDNLEQSKIVVYYDNTDIAFSNVVSWKIDDSLDPFKREIINELNSELNRRVTSIRSNIEIVEDYTKASNALDRRLNEIDSDLQKIEEMETEFLVNPIWTDKRGIYESANIKDSGIVYVFPLLAIFIILMLASTSIIYDKQTNFLTRVKSTTAPISYLVAKLIFFTSLVAAQFIIIYLIFLISGATLNPSMIGILELILMIGIIDTLIGLIIGLLAKNEGIAVLFSLMISFPLMLLSGIFFPIQSLPKVAQWIGSILPLEFQINASKQVLLFGDRLSWSWVIPAGILFLAVIYMIRKDI